MTLALWYELRVIGSAGTHAGIASGAREGLAITENGRLCAIASGRARKFESEEEALRYLETATFPELYDFEPVLCRPDVQTGDRPASLHP